MEDKMKSNLTRGSTWLRGLIMLLFTLLYGVGEVVVTAVALFQFGAALITGAPNSRLLSLGQSLSTWMYQVILFFTFRSEERPFPFGDWPKGPPEAAVTLPEAVREPEEKEEAAKPEEEGSGREDKGET